MIRNIRLKFGPAGHKSGLDLYPTTMTVFVGANNAGKSLVLRELTAYCERGPQEGRKIVETLEIALPEIDEVSAHFKKLETPLGAGESLPEGHIRIARFVPATGHTTSQDVNWQVFKDNLPGWKAKQDSGTLDWRQEIPAWFFSWYVVGLTLSLDGTTRLSLTDERERGDLLGVPLNHLAALFVDDKARKRLRDIVHEAFGLYLVLDPTNGNKLRVRLSEKAPSSITEEQSLDAQARAFHQQAEEITSFSDGVKAFSGLMAALVCSDYRIILIDEPEAFLHPTLVRKLGREMAQIAANRGGNVLATTHSSSFLMGCMESGKPVSIVRLTYDKPDATAQLLPPERIRELMLDPLLRSSRVLEALFYRGAVVTESDADRALYDEINNRLERSHCCYVPDSLFLNAHNKQTIRRIVKLLRGMGIPAAAVVDIDILKGADLRDLLRECNVPAGVAQSIGQLKGSVLSSLEGSGADWESQGIRILTGEQREACQNLLTQLAAYGIFVVPIGQLESWLANIGATPSKNKSYWLESAFTLLGTDPDESSYVQPSTGDVWQFLRGIAEWIRDRDRRGMPRPDDPVND